MRAARASSWALKPVLGPIDDRARVEHSRRMSKKSSQSPKGLRQFVDSDQQDAWLEGRAELADAGERQDSIEQRMRSAPRFQKLLSRPQAPDIFEIHELYGRNCDRKSTSLN